MHLTNLNLVLWRNITSFIARHEKKVTARAFPFAVFPVCAHRNDERRDLIYTQPRPFPWPTLAAPLIMIAGDQGKSRKGNSSTAGEFPPSDKGFFAILSNLHTLVHTRIHAVNKCSEKQVKKTKKVHLFQQSVYTNRIFKNQGARYARFCANSTFQQLTQTVEHGMLRNSGITNLYSFSCPQSTNARTTNSTRRV